MIVPRNGVCEYSIQRVGYINGYIFLILRKNIYFFVTLRGCQGTVDQQKQFQYTSEPLFLSAIVPINRALPAGILTEKNF